MMRRGAWILAFLSLSACGLRPLYGGGSSGVVASTMRSVMVGPIGGQSGWLMRNKLVERLGESGGATPAYRLDVTLDDNITAFGLRGDRAATRVRRTLRERCPRVP
jgi:LPS-assembly lipoprotein